MKPGCSLENWQFAAGGIVERRVEGRLEIAVIHRPRYDDWSLPKGKTESGETLIETAIREVKEETMHRVAVEGFAGAIHYVASGVPKILLNWRMSLLEILQGPESDEVDKVVWLTPSEAVAKISYAQQRNSINDLYKENTIDCRKSKWDTLRALKTLLLENDRYRRLEAAIYIFQVDLGAEVNQEVALDNVSALETCRSLLQSSKVCLGKGQIDEGWRFLTAAQANQALILSESRSATLIASLTNEMEKLNPWRKRTIEALIGSHDEPTH